jgi:dihydroorotate dehydrogenase (NAD+) catalytic subunit
MGVDLSVDIGGLTIQNPIMTASGTFGYGEEFAPFVDLVELGGIIVKGISLEPRAGNAPSRIVETPSGMLNAIGLQNVGIDAFIEKKIPMLEQLGCVVFVNVLGDSIDDYAEIARRLDPYPSLHGLEINISCPNVKKGGVVFGSSPEMAGRVTEAVKANTSKPVMVKLSPNVTSVSDMAKAVEQAGADSISVINTLIGMAIDSKTRKPILDNVIGGLSGPAIKPVALRMVYEAAKAVDIPVIGIGGINSLEDVIEFLIAGASAVQIGTMNFVNPAASGELLHGLQNYLESENITINELIGSIQLPSN